MENKNNLKGKKGFTIFDICIIGAGVVGANIARELSKYKLKIIMLEKMKDVSLGATKANSGIVHGGYAAKNGTLKAQLCYKGNRMYKELNKELNFGYRKTGSMVLAFREEERRELKKQYENGIKNGVKGLKIIDAKEILKMEPNINTNIVAGLYCEEAGVTSPYEFTIALMENAIKNGVKLKLKAEVLDIKKKKDYFEIGTEKEQYKSKYIINAAGVYSDHIASMVGENNFKIIPRRGQYIILDKGTGEKVHHVIFQVPTKEGKGILVTSTYHGNLLIGPNAEEVSYKEDIGTEKTALDKIIETAKKSVPNFNLIKTIRTFSGIRATPSTGDFIIEETNTKGFINVAGIESPGLTASPAIALYVVEILEKMGIKFIKKEDFNPYRPPIITEKDISPEEIKERLFIQPSPEKIICRCEVVSEGEIVDALHRNIDINSPDSVKLRTRAGMGRCQGAFCENRVREIIAREKNISLDKVPHKDEHLKGRGKREPARFYMDKE